VNLVDVAAVLLVALAIYFGWRSGFIIQLLALVGFLGGIALMVLIAPHAAELVADMDPWLRTVVSIGVVAGIVLLAQGLGSGAGAAVKRRIGPGILTGIDHGLGAAFGLARGVFMVWLIGGQHDRRRQARVERAEHEALTRLRSDVRNRQQA